VTEEDSTYLIRNPTKGSLNWRKKIRGSRRRFGGSGGSPKAE
jgi:hypothetical protein